MKVLLLCGYRTSDEQETPLGLERDSDGITLIDQRIQQLQEMGLEVICIVAGNIAEAQLRQCSRIANVELVYDDEQHPSLLTNIRFGLEAVDDDGCFVLPVELPSPPAEYWARLKEEWRKVRFDSDYSFLQGVDTTTGAPCHLGFPLIVTRAGNKQIVSTPEIRQMLDARLKYLCLNFSPQAGLAPSAKPI